MFRVLSISIAILLFGANAIAQRRAVPRPEPTPATLATPTLAVPLDPAPGWESDDAGAYSTGMVWRDINNDGQVDVFFSNGNDMARAENSAYFLQNWQLPPVATWLSGNPEYSGHCSAGDIDDDGFTDFVVANYLGENRFASPGRTNLYRNSAGTLPANPSWLSADSFYSFSCALGDLDGDGDLDLAVATGDAYNAIFERDRIYINNDGTLDALPTWQSDQLTAALDVCWGDIDNDGDLDLALCYDNLPTAVYLNADGDLSTSPDWQASGTDPANTIVFGDINNDGWLDLLVAHNNQLGGGGRFSAYLNDGAGSLHASPDWTSSDGGYGSALSLYDYDLDGDLDLAAGRWFDRPRIYENLGGTFTSDPVWRADLTTVPEEMAWIDVDASGVESLADTIVADGRTVLYSTYAPWYLLDSIVVDGARLDHPDFCYDPIAGWISLAVQPTLHTVIYYQYSFTADLTVANWDTNNHVYVNSSEHFINFYADANVGWAPFTVHFTDSTNDVLSWDYDFGDGTHSYVPDPIHTYELPGAYDVVLSVTTSSGSYSRTMRSFIVALADTVTFGIDSVYPGEEIIIPVYLTNSQPLHTIMVPVSLADLPINISPHAVTLGSRTAGFNPPGFISYVHANDRYDMTLELTANTSGPLPPGTGEILRIHATVDWYAPVGAANIIDTIPNGLYDCRLTTFQLAYAPRIVSGALRTRYVARGDLSTDGRLTLTDLTRLVNYLFVTGTRPIAYVVCDINGDGQVNLTDVTYLVNYLFLLGPPPPPYP